MVSDDEGDDDDDIDLSLELLDVSDVEWPVDVVVVVVVADDNVDDVDKEVVELVFCNLSAVAPPGREKRVWSSAYRHGQKDWNKEGLNLSE